MIRLFFVLPMLAVLASCAGWQALNADTMGPQDARVRVSEAKDRKAPTPWQKARFGRLAELVGQTYKSEPAEADSAEPSDITTWDWALGGQAISSVHALEDGSYGGESLIYFDNETGGLAYVYVTTAGFRTEGTYRLNEDGSWVAEEDVIGHESITKVRSSGRLRADGVLAGSSEYFRNGEWVPGRNALYRPVTGIAPAFADPESSG